MNIVLSIIIFLFGYLLILPFVKYFNTNVTRVTFIYIWHSFFCFVYYHYTLINIADSFFYYEESFLSDANFQLGTGFVIFLTNFFTVNFGFSYFNLFLIHNIIGVLGLMAFDSSIKSVCNNRKKSIIILLVSNIVFLPSISFWSSALGKDAISFLATCLALWASLSLGRRWLLMLTSIILMMLVRPHIGGLMIISLTVVIFYRNKSIPTFKKITLALTILIGAYFAIPFALEYSGLRGDISFQAINDYFEMRQGYNQEGGGGIDISQMSLPVQLFTYIFLPLPFEANGIAALAASFDNLLLMLLFIYALFCYFLARKRENLKILNNSFIIVYPFLTWVILAMTTANLGISLRQKWMFLPMLLYIAVSFIAAANPARAKK